MKEIKLSGDNTFVALVDDDDYAFVASKKWYPVKHARNTYAARYEAGKTIYMHRIIMAEQLKASGLTYPVVDHKSNQSLDNRKENLQVTTHAKNLQRQRLATNNRSGYRGVSLTQHGRFRAAIGYQSKRIWIGEFATALEAFHAYVALAIELYGDAMPSLESVIAPELQNA